MNYAFGANINKPPKQGHTHNRQYGNAILSKYPIIDSENYHLTKLHDSEETRGLLGAQIHVSGENLWFYTTHLDPSLDPTTRAEQVKDIHNITSQHPHSILVGDMNTPQKGDYAPELEPILKQYKDAWALKHGRPGYTWPAIHPRMRIDYIFVAPDIKIDSVQLIKSSASDHRLLTATVMLQSGTHPLSASGLKN